MNNTKVHIVTAYLDYYSLHACIVYLFRTYTDSQPRGNASMKRLEYIPREVQAAVIMESRMIFN